MLKGLQVCFRTVDLSTAYSYIALLVQFRYVAFGLTII